MKENADNPDKKSGGHSHTSTKKSEISKKIESELKRICEGLSDSQMAVFEAAVIRRQNLFFTGSAGTGKSFVLQKIIKGFTLFKDIHVAVTASTGVAAVNIGGGTLHSFIGAGLANDILEVLVKHVKSRKPVRERWCETDVLIVDEISMINGSLFSKINLIAKNIRENESPFGGIQIILSGDFLQLPPVITEHGEELLCSPDSLVFETIAFKETIGTNLYELDTPFRQNGDLRFYKILQNIRYDEVTDEDAALLGTRVFTKDELLELEQTDYLRYKKELETFVNNIVEGAKERVFFINTILDYIWAIQRGKMVYVKNNQFRVQYERYLMFCEDGVKPIFLGEPKQLCPDALKVPGVSTGQQKTILDLLSTRSANYLEEPEPKPTIGNEININREQNNNEDNVDGVSIADIFEKGLRSDSLEPDEIQSCGSDAEDYAYDMWAKPSRQQYVSATGRVLYDNANSFLGKCYKMGLIEKLYKQIWRHTTRGRSEEAFDLSQTPFINFNRFQYSKLRMAMEGRLEIPIEANQEQLIGKLSIVEYNEEKHLRHVIALDGSPRLAMNPVRLYPTRKQVNEENEAVITLIAKQKPGNEREINEIVIVAVEGKVSSSHQYMQGGRQGNRNAEWDDRGYRGGRDRQVGNRQDTDPLKNVIEPNVLHLCTGCLVMLTKNMTPTLVNGSRGKILSIRTERRSVNETNHQNAVPSAMSNDIISLPSLSISSSTIRDGVSRIPSGVTMQYNQYGNMPQGPLGLRDVTQAIEEQERTEYVSVRNGKLAAYRKEYSFSLTPAAELGPRHLLSLDVVVTVMFDDPTRPGRKQTIDLREAVFEVVDGEQVKALRLQIPLIPAYALSIHKCQGLSLSSIAVAFDRVFHREQVYTALSRCRDLNGIHILNEQHRGITRGAKGWLGVIGVRNEERSNPKCTNFHRYVTRLNKATLSKANGSEEAREAEVEASPPTFGEDSGGCGKNGMAVAPVGSHLGSQSNGLNVSPVCTRRRTDEQYQQHKIQTDRGVDFFATNSVVERRDQETEGDSISENFVFGGFKDDDKDCAVIVPKAKQKPSTRLDIKGRIAIGDAPCEEQEECLEMFRKRKKTFKLSHFNIKERFSPEDFYDTVDKYMRRPIDTVGYKQVETKRILAARTQKLRSKEWQMRETKDCSVQVDTESSTQQKVVNNLGKGSSSVCLEEPKRSVSAGTGGNSVAHTQRLQPVLQVASQSAVNLNLYNTVFPNPVKHQTQQQTVSQSNAVISERSTTPVLDDRNNTNNINMGISSPFQKDIRDPFININAVGKRVGASSEIYPVVAGTVQPVQSPVVVYQPMSIVQHSSQDVPISERQAWRQMSVGRNQTQVNNGGWQNTNANNNPLSSQFHFGTQNQVRKSTQNTTPNEVQHINNNSYASWHNRVFNMNTNNDTMNSVIVNRVENLSPVPKIPFLEFLDSVPSGGSNSSSVTRSRAVQQDKTLSPIGHVSQPRLTFDPYSQIHTSQVGVEGTVGGGSSGASGSGNGSGNVGNTNTEGSVIAGWISGRISFPYG